jgi:putative RecB family exonuclease
LPEAFTPSNLVFGSAIHHALQFHFEQLLVGRQPPDLDGMLAAFWESWQLHDGKQIRFGVGETIDSTARLAERMLRAFQGSELARPSGAILAVEEEMRGALPGCPELLARIDLVVETADALVVTDFKTARSAWSFEQVAESAMQLLLYGELVQDLSEKPLRLEFAVLTKTKLPTISRHQIPFDAVQANRTRRIALRIWHAIEAGHFYPNPTPAHCTGCPYRKPCQSWAG